MQSNLKEKKEFLAEFNNTYEKGYEGVYNMYDEMVTIVGDHIGPVIHGLFKEFDIPKESRILDVGCGTGRAVQLVSQDGYKNIDGLDPSEEMIKVAMTKGIYQKFISGYLTTPEEVPKDLVGAYDVVVAGALFITPKHAEPEAYECLPCVLKKGGLAIFTTDEFNQTPAELAYKEKRMAMVKEGKWKLLKEFQGLKYDKLTEELATKDGRFSGQRMETFSVFQKL